MGGEGDEEGEEDTSRGCSHMEHTGANGLVFKNVQMLHVHVLVRDNVDVADDDDDTATVAAVTTLSFNVAANI
jgi:hypothetical protein